VPNIHQLSGDGEQYIFEDKELLSGAVSVCNSMLTITTP
jgi:hypothetical protein